MQARSSEPDACGTAPYATAVLLLEAALPWPAHPLEHPQARPLTPILQAFPQLRLQLAARQDERHNKFVMFRHIPELGGFSRYEESYETGEDVARGVTALLTSDPDDPVWTPPAAHATDVLVCTHGSRDRCCGSYGTRLYKQVQTCATDVTLWRTSHLGGHRFAPTALVFPFGQAWAWTSEDLWTSMCLGAPRTPSDRPHYRGSIAVSDPRIQLLEREATAGWGPLTRTRYSAVTPLAGADTRSHVEIAFCAGAETRIRWIRGVVAEGDAVPIPKCGVPLDQSPNHQPRLNLEAVWGDVERPS